jgi:site-specific recombinase XerD
MAVATKAELATLLEPWLATLRVRSANTARSYEHAARGFLDALPESDEITTALVAPYLDSLAGLSPASRAHHVSATKAFLRFAQRQGTIATSLLDMLVRPRVTVTSFNRYLDEAELGRLINAAGRLGPRHLAAVMLLAGTGVRVGEAVGAEWRDLFLDPAGRLGLRVVGKGSKERVVKVRADVFAALVALHGSDELDGRDTTPLLPDSQGTRVTTRWLHKLVSQAAAEAGITKPVSPHWLRHSHATLAALHGASAFAIQSSLGHSRLETSERYVHWSRGLEDTTVDSLPAFHQDAKR